MTVKEFLATEAAGPKGGIPPVRYLWETRRCWICRKYGACEHREPEVELAEVVAELRAEMRAMVQGILRKTA